MTEQEALVVLNAIPGMGSVRIAALREYYGDARTALTRSFEDLTASAVVPPNIIENIVHFSKDKFLIDEYNLLTSRNVSLVTIVDEDYPHLLASIPGAPVVLYILGNKALLHNAMVAMVGSRMCSYYGRAQAVRFAEMFAQAGVAVISGLARGIDTAAHQGTLKAGGTTLAVVGCGFDHIYPKENKALMEEIIAKGAVVSELPMRTPPVPANFPRRNRIITGLSLATVVVEAGEKSGALISAGYALEQGRDVYAVPANVDHVSAAGSNQLLKDGAIIALKPHDVLEGLKEQMGLVYQLDTVPQPSTVIVENEQAKVLALLTTEPMHADELASRAGMSTGQIASIVLHLQLKELVKELPGKYFIKEYHGKITRDR